MDTFTLIVLLICASVYLNANETSIAPLSSTTNIIVNEDGKRVYSLRLKAVRELPSELSDVEIEALVEFLYLPPEKDTSVNEGELAAIKNDLMGYFCVRKRAEMITPHVVKMSDMPQLGHIWNNYCIQFFARLYPLVDKENQSAIREAYHRYLLLPTDLRAGTSLISIRTVMKESQYFSKDTFIDSAWRIYSADSVIHSNQLTAFQILGDFGDYRALRDARNYLNAPASDIHSRMASLAILGKHGIAKDIPLLETYSKHADLRLRTAATRNLKSLKKRLAEHE